MSAKPITLGRFHFATMSALKAKWSALIEARSILQGDDHELAMEVLKAHPSRDRKIGCGIDYFVPRKAEFGLYGMALWRLDGSTEMFAPKFGVNKADEALEAMRDAVRGQIEAFRKTLPEVFNDPVTGEEVFRGDAHIDHDPVSFKRLALEFANGDLESITTVKQAKTSIRGMADPELKRRWEAYHLEHAQLRGVSQKTNLTKARDC